jgi:hypothetical protein
LRNIQYYFGYNTHILHIFFSPVEKLKCVLNSRASYIRSNKVKEKAVLVIKYLSTTPWRRIGSGCIDPLFLTSAFAGGEWSASRPCRFTLAERVPGTHWIGDWVGPRAGLDDVEKQKFLTLPGLELRPLGRPARSQSLYRLRCPGSHIRSNTAIKTLSTCMEFLNA